MSRLINDYHCLDCLTVTEHWVNKEEEATLTCPECSGSQMTKIIGAPKLCYTEMATGNSSDGMNKAIDKWDKMRRQKMRIEKRIEERHGPQPQ